MKNWQQGRGRRSICWEKTYDLLVNCGRQMTAYQIARKIGCTPQHVNRMLKKKFAFGTVGYRVVPHGIGEKRIWASIYTVEQFYQEYEWQVAMEKLL